jgi:aerobic-type carbon monoxide dehydrogenase small subunit (CoxS/CutS family)
MISSISTLNLTVNGKQLSLPIIPRETLTDLFGGAPTHRDKIGCEDRGGACTVLVDGEPILSCVTTPPRQMERRY